MEIGIQFSQPAVRPSPVDSLRRHLELVALAHELRFRSYWAGQHFMSSAFLLFQPLTLLARAAAVAPKMKMGTSVLLLPMLNPLDVAEHGATLDAITEGGFILGVGLGYRDEEFAGSGVKKEHMLERYEESVEMIQRLWGEPPANFSGKHFRLREARINPRPVQRPRPPLLIGAYAERGVERAGRLSDGWIVPPELFGPLLERRFERFRQASDSNRTRGMVAIMRAFHLTEDRSEADRVEELLTAHFQKKRDWGILKGDEVTRTTAAENAREASIIGDAEECLQKIETVIVRYRPDHLILLMGFRGIPEESLERSMRIAGEKILPRI